MTTTAEFRNSPLLCAYNFVQLTAADAPRISELSKLCKEIDRKETIQSPEQIERELNTPDVHFEGNLLGVETETGKLIAIVSTVPMPGSGGFFIPVDVTVDPEFRDGNLEPALLEFAVENAREWAEKNKANIEIQAACREDQSNYIQLYTQAGFLPVRYFHTMERDLVNLPIEPAVVADGYIIKAIDPGNDDHIKDLHVTLLEAFRDHFNPIDFTVEQAAHWVRSHEFLDGFIILAYAHNEDGTLTPAGASVNRIRKEYNAQHNKKEGEVNALGVRRAYRRKGLARALLLTSLQIIKNAGMESAELSVDSENPLGANLLYSSVGFTPRKTNVVYQLP